MEKNIVLPLLVFFPMVAAVLSYLIGRKNKEARNIWVSIVTFLVMIGTFMLVGKDASYSLPGFCSLGLSFEGDGLRVILAIVTSSIWFITTLFSKEYFTHFCNRNRYYFFMLMTLGATLGVFLSGDLYTTLIFFEIMSFTSFVLVIHEEKESTIRAAKSYLGVAIIGGLVTLMGLFLMYHMAGTLNIDALAEFMAAQEDKRAFYAVGVLILFGFAAKAGIFPLHTWLPESYPAAPAPATALLSCVLSKAGIFGVLVLSCKIFLHDANWGGFILFLGVITMVLGAVLAVFSVNLKRTLACSSMSQIGFIVVAIGMQGLLGSHNALAAGGTILHVINHSLLKLVLFLSAGVVYMNLQKLNLNEIRGWGKDKPLLKISFLMAVLGIGGIPFWNGYISKTMIHESIVEYIEILHEAGLATGYMQTVEWLFLFSGGLTLAYMTKIFVALFVEKNPYAEGNSKNIHEPYMSKLSAILLIVCAVILPVIGVVPHMTADKIADASYHFMGAHAPEHAVHFFAWINLKGAVISVVIGALVYFLFIRKVLMVKDHNGNLVYVDRWPVGLNLENKIYRPALLSWLPFIGAFFARLAASLTDGFISILRMLIFNDDTGRVVPPEDQYFSTYADSDDDEEVYGEGFAKSLLMIGIGLAVAMLYILF
ncbi:complex I subunit 5 family protein [Anaerotignum sp.]|uniref:complex I subunit 5 family protein n=1 Tax=Anaerotignum sp. TaxID=2039241 RepID=UPI002714DE5F|nr:complex I subunit 5 family protein [Anaerotignum sp.]